MSISGSRPQRKLLGGQRAQRLLDEVRRDAHHARLAVDDAAAVGEDVERVVGLDPHAGALEDLERAEVDVVQLGLGEHVEAEPAGPGAPGVQVAFHWRHLRCGASLAATRRRVGRTPAGRAGRHGRAARARRRPRGPRVRPARARVKRRRRARQLRRAIRRQIARDGASSRKLARRTSTGRSLAPDGRVAAVTTRGLLSHIYFTFGHRQA